MVSYPESELELQSIEVYLSPQICNWRAGFEVGGRGLLLRWQLLGSLVVSVAFHQL